MGADERLPLLAAGASKPERSSFNAFLKSFWPTAFVGFGGPQAHVALFHSIFVDTESVDSTTGKARPHVAEGTFLELYALSQSLPGPGSTQLATALGATFGGFWGAWLTFFIFTLPGLVVMTLAGLWYHGHLNSTNESLAFIERFNEYIFGLISAAFAMVALAAYKIITKCCDKDRVRYAVCIITGTIAVCVPPSSTSSVYILLLILGGCVALVEQRFLEHNGNGERDERTQEAWECGISRGAGVFLIALFSIVTGIAIFSSASSQAAHIFKVFWTIGAIGFGGGIVVIPMLLNEIVEQGFLPNSVFLAGFALFGCVPGPMFNIAPFLGAAIASWPGAFRAGIGLFAPGIVIMLGVLPFWEQVRKKTWVRNFVDGVNSAASGLILAGVWMIMKRTLVGPATFSLSISAGAAMTVFGISSPVAILIHGVVGVAFTFFNVGGPFSS